MNSNQYSSEILECNCNNQKSTFCIVNLSTFNVILRLCNDCQKLGRFSEFISKTKLIDEVLKN